MMMLLTNLLRYQRQFFFISLHVLVLNFCCGAQTNYGVVKGSVRDGSTNKELAGVAITSSAKKNTATIVDGSYLIKILPGNYELVFSKNGFQTKTITGIRINDNSITQVNIVLIPLTENQQTSLRDSLPPTDSVYQISLNKEKREPVYNLLKKESSIDVIVTKNISSGNGEDGAQILQRLNGVTVESSPLKTNEQQLNISGLGNRYNSVMLNGVDLSSFGPINKEYPFSVLPVEAIEKLSIQKIGNSSLPADYSGGNVEIKTKDFPEKNFVYVSVSASLLDATIGKNFYGDKRGQNERFGFPGNVRDLPNEFPNAKSQVSFNFRSLAEQIQLSKLLKNNLGPINHGSSQPNEKFVFGFGRTINLSSDKRLGIIAFLTQAKTERVDQSIVQVQPDIVSNPYPFSTGKVLINAQSNDQTYRYSSYSSAVLNSSFIYKQNKISFSNFFGSLFENAYTQRSAIYKPDEDTLAHFGVHYLAKQQLFVITSLAGEHALNSNGNFKLNWHVAYNFSHEKNPDERSFLLRQDLTGNKFEIAHPMTAPFNPPLFSDPDVYDPGLTNTSRQWRDKRDNNLEGSANLSIPFNFFHHAQAMSGGVYIQSMNRVFYSDLLQTKGSGFYPLNEILSPDRYDSTGGLSVTGYYKNFGGSYSYVYANNRGNYQASSNVGACFVRLENKITKNIDIDWGVRVESSAQLVSNTQYSFLTGERSLIPLDKNIFVNRVDVLPSVRINYSPINKIHVYGAWFETLNRPQLQELTGYRYYDPLLFQVKIGNPILQTTSISNYNAGINLLFDARTSISVGGFYKKIEQPIENILFYYTKSSLISQPNNTPPAIAKGINGSFKFSLDNLTQASWLSDAYLFADANLLDSKVKKGWARKLDDIIQEHSLSGSPKISANGGFVLQHHKFPEITILYSYMGDYIAALGSGELYQLSNGNEVQTIPAYRIKERQQFSAQVSQRLFQNKLQVTAGVRNILNNPFILYQDLNGNKKFDSPLTLTNSGVQAGIYSGGVDNTIVNIKNQRLYHLTISWLFGE